PTSAMPSAKKAKPLRTPRYDEAARGSLPLFASRRTCLWSHVIVLALRPALSFWSESVLQANSITRLVICAENQAHLCDLVFMSQKEETWPMRRKFCDRYAEADLGERFHETNHMRDAVPNRGSVIPGRRALARRARNP